MVTHMHIVSIQYSREAWYKASQEQLDELFCILSHGYASTFLPGNICYTVDGKFACIDTEVPMRRHNLKRVKEYFSEPMNLYWDQLIETHLGH